MERHFPISRALSGRNDIAGARSRATRSRRIAIGRRPPAAAHQTTGKAFFQSCLIILREGFEAILVSARVAFLLKTVIASGSVNLARPRARPRGESGDGRRTQTLLAAMPAAARCRGDDDAHRRRRALLRELLAHLEGRGREVAEVHSREGDIRARAWRWKALALVAFLAVYREGAETALSIRRCSTRAERRVASCSRNHCRFRGTGGSLTLSIDTASRFRCDRFSRYQHPALLHGVRVHGKGIRELQENIMLSP